MGLTVGMLCEGTVYTMRKRKKTRIAVSAVLIAACMALAMVFFACSKPPPKKPDEIPIGDYSYTTAYVEYEVDRLMGKLDLPSVVVAMIDGDDVVYSNAFGMADIEADLPATMDTAYKIGSITKLFVGIEVMRMAEEGLVDLDAPITEYLPDFSVLYHQDSGPITVRSILAHESGLPREGTLLDWHWDERPYVLGALADSLGEEHQAYPAGYRFKYSNVGYNVLARLIEVVRGAQPPAEQTAGGFPYYMHDALLEPMGLDDTEFGSLALLYENAPEQKIAMGYYHENGKNTAVNQFDTIELGSGNMISTGSDMIAFAQYILGIGKTDEDKIISGEALWEMYTYDSALENNPKAIGLSWFRSSIFGEMVVFHTGTNQGFISMLMLMPEQQLGLVLLCNSGEFEDVQNALAFEAMALMLETKTGSRPLETPSPAATTMDSGMAAGYVGKYIINGEVIEVTANGGLTAIYRGQKVKMERADNAFRLDYGESDITVSFFTDDLSGEQTMVVHMGDYFVCPKYPVADEAPAAWHDLVGKYTAVARHPSVYSDSDILGEVTIEIDDGVLLMSGGKAILPIGTEKIRIVGGIYDGETMVYDAQSGSITWQQVIYMPVSE